MAKVFQYFVLLAVWLNVQETTAACNGEHQYLENGSCFECERCPSGQQPKEFCLRGMKSDLYSCQVCPPNSFSENLDYDPCKTCKPCSRWNSETATKCTKTRDAVCGDCFAGYFRPMLSDGTRDHECHKCTEETEDHPECKVHSDNRRWLLIIIGIASVSVFIIGVLVCVIVYIARNNKRKQELNTKDGNNSNKNNSSNAGGTAEECERLTLAARALNHKDCRSSIVSDEVRNRGHRLDIDFQQHDVYYATCVFQPTKADSSRSDVISEIETSLRLDPISASAPPYSQITNTFGIPPVFINEHPLQACAWPRPRPPMSGMFDSQPRSSITIDPSGNYSEMSTAEFNTNPGSSYSNMPTSPFDETVNVSHHNDTNGGHGAPSNVSARVSQQSIEQMRQSRTSDNSHAPIRRRGSSGSNRRRRQADTSSSESLLRNIDRDSTIVSPVGRDSPMSSINPSNVEFFDTTGDDDDVTKVKETYISSASNDNNCNVWKKPSSSDNLPHTSNWQPARSFDSAAISRPRPNPPLISPGGSMILPPPDVRVAISPAQSCASVSSQEKVFSKHKKQIKEVDENFNKAQEKVKDVPLKNLDPGIAERITLQLNDLGDPHLTIKSWRHVGTFFDIDNDILDNFRSMTDILRYLRAHTCHTVADLMQAIHHVQRYDVLSVMCDHILYATSGKVNTLNATNPSFLSQYVSVHA